MSKTLYHSNLVKIGPVEAVITSDVLNSKFKKAGSPNKFINLTIAGAEHSLNIENEACATALEGLNGQTVTLEASGSRDSAAITIFGQAAPENAPAKPTGAARPAPAQPAAAPYRPAPQSKPAASHPGVFGGTVGMCMKEACAIVTAMGTDPFSADFYTQVEYISIRLVKMSDKIQSGDLEPVVDWTSKQ